MGFLGPQSIVNVRLEASTNKRIWAKGLGLYAWLSTAPRPKQA